MYICNHMYLYIYIYTYIQNMNISIYTHLRVRSTNQNWDPFAAGVIPCRSAARHSSRLTEPPGVLGVDAFPMSTAAWETPGGKEVET